MSSKHLVAPDLLAAAEEMGSFSISANNLAAVRANREATSIDDADIKGVDKAEHTIPGRPGDPDISVMVYQPSQRSGDALPAILHIHGGGYVIGSPAMSDLPNQLQCRDLGCVIASVDYRLSPETAHPGPVEDCYAALAWMHQEADILGIDPNRIAIKGESAGGGLAAGLALLARDRGEYPICHQHLTYPMIDDRSAQSDHPYVGEFVWTRESNHFGWASLLGQEPGSEDVSPYAAAARAEDLSNLPPTYISTAALDLFLEENLEYARRLTRAGVPMELHVYPGAFHGFQMANASHASEQYNADSIAALRHALFDGAKPA